MRQRFFRALRAEGGGVSDDPIDVSKAFSIPTGQLQPIQAHIPQLNFQQPQAQQQSSGGSTTLLEPQAHRERRRRGHSTDVGVF